MASTGLEIAEDIQRTVQEKTRLTVSRGVSFSQIYIKLGSNMKQPDEVTVIDENNYREKMWPLPMSDHLYVGPQTTKMLRGINIETISNLANFGPALIQSIFGTNSINLWSLSNSTTTPL